MLTPLTARAVGAWWLSLGFAAAHSSRENDWQRVYIATISYAVLGFFPLSALLRYPQLVDWTMPSAWIYSVFLVSILLVGVYGWRQSARLSRVETIAATPTVV